MLKSLALLGIGAAAGAAGTAYFVSQQQSFTLGSGDSPSLLESVADFALRRDDNSRQAASVADHLAAYSAAQAQTDVAGLQGSLETAASAAPTPERDLQIDALLMRLSEFEPALAVSKAIDLALEPQFIVAAYVLWAEADPQAALDTLPSFPNPALRRELALALLDVVGNDAAGAALIADALSAGERDSFMLDRLGQHAVDSPVEAFREAQALLDSEMQRKALAAVAESWAAQDPRGALNQAASLADPALAQRFKMAAYSEWARIDPGGLADYLESGVTFENEMTSGLQYLLISDAERAIRIAEGFGGTIGPQLAATAIGVLAESDPASAMNRVAAMAPGPARNYAVQAVGSAMARTDPDAALDWVQSLSPPSPDAVRSVAMLIASSNPERALALMDSMNLGSESSLIMSMLSSQLARDPEQVSRIADQLAERDDMQSAAALRNLVGNWVRRDPESALDWVLTNGAQVDAAALGSAAQAMASRDPQAAIAYLDRIPAQFRNAWITQVAGPYGRYDPNAAMGWVAQFQGQLLYTTALREVINNAAQTDPRLAAQMLTQANVEVQFASAGNVASVWAQQEPRAAADWASSLTDERARSMAVSNAVGRWATSDPAAARRWTLDMRAGETRDQSLQMLLQRGATQGDFDRSLLDSFSSATARRNALQSSITMLAREHPDLAHELLDSEVTDANTRRQIEQQIERQNAQTATSILIR